MNQVIQLALVGAAAGVLTALMGSGLLLIYRSSKVINFGHGAVATFGTFTYLQAANEWGWHLVPAIALGVATSAAIGGLFQVIALRHLRTAPPVARLVATLGLFMGLTAAIIPVFRVERPSRIRFFGSDPVTLPFGLYLPFDRVVLIAVTAGCLVILALGYRYSRFGRSTRAGADNQLATSLMGYSPDRIEFLNWVLGSALAGLAGVLLSTISQPDPLSLTHVMIAALAAALVAKFRSFAGLLVVSIAIGAARAVIGLYTTELQNLTGLVGWGSALPLIIIIAAVVLGGKSIERKGAFDEEPLPAAPALAKPWKYAIAALVIGAGVALLAPKSALEPLTLSLIGVVLALSVVVVTGYAGQISLVQAGLAGFGAFAAARLGTDLGLPFPLAVLFGALCTVPLGVAVGLPALRVRGLQLGVVTLGAAIVLDVMFFADRRFTGGESGLKVPPASIGPLDVSGIGEPRRYALVVLVVAILVGLGVAALRSSRLGSQLLACRSNERGAAASGLSVPRLKLLAFGISAFIAGLAGALQAYRSTQISWGGFAFIISIALVSTVYIGGVARIGGAVFAGIAVAGGLLTYVLNFEGTAGHIYNVVAGLGVIFIVIVHPDGFVTIFRDLRAHLFGRRRQADVIDAGPGASSPAVAVGSGEREVIGR